MCTLKIINASEPEFGGPMTEYEDYHAGEVCMNTASKFFGKKIASETVYLRKQGAGTNVSVKIYDKNRTLKATLATYCSRRCNCFGYEADEWDLALSCD